MRGQVIKNATITSTMLGWEDHGIFTFVLHLDYGGSGQGAGYRSLDTFDKARDKRVGTAFGLSLMMRLLKVVGVRKWEDLKGKHIRVKSGHANVSAVGNFLREDWLDFEEFFEEECEANV